MDSYRNPSPGKTYVSPSLKSFGVPGQKVRIATKLIEHPVTYAFAQMKNEVVLRHKENARTTVTAKFFEDDRGVFVLTIQGYSVATQKPHNASFSFIGEEIDRLVEFLNHIQAMPLRGKGASTIPDATLRKAVVSRDQAQALIEDNPDLFAALISKSLTKQDVVAVAYRKTQLEVFERLLSDEAYFRRLLETKGCTEESLWQKFFEKNPWIFGYGLSYVYLSGWDSKKLEQVVSGHMAFKPGKKADALMRSRGLISSLGFVEIKTHKTHLLEKTTYRSGCWAPSKELTQAVAQSQGTLAMAAMDIRWKLEGKTSDGRPTGEDAYNYVPKAFLVAGSLKEFRTELGVNEEQHRSFELFRRNTLNPEILTFDELFERARFIVHQHEAGQK